MVQVVLTKAILLTVSPTDVRELPAGPQDLPAEIADHWFVRAHREDQPEAAPAPGSDGFARRMRLAQLQADGVPGADKAPDANDLGDAGQETATEESRKSSGGKGSSKRAGGSVELSDEAADDTASGRSVKLDDKA